MAKKHATSNDVAEHDNVDDETAGAVSETETQDNANDVTETGGADSEAGNGGEVFNEADAFDNGEGDVGEDGIPTLKVGALVIPAPDKYAAGHVMTEDEAAHYSNFIRGRCASNMISLEKRNKRVWTSESAAEYYENYVLGAPRGRGPSDETVRDEALEALLEDLATTKGLAVPKGKGSKQKRDELKEFLGKSPKYAEQLAALEIEIRASYAAKNKTDTAKTDTISLDDLA